MSDLQTVLNAAHRRLGARMVPFGGWDMPLQYEGILAEHHATRTAATVFDTSHMDAFRVEGPDAWTFLDRALSPDLAALRPGRCRYGFLLREDGGILDDLIVYRLGDRSAMVVVNASTAPGDFAELQSRCGAFGGQTTLRDLREEQGKLDVQGPSALSVAARVLGVPLVDLPYFAWRPIRYHGADGLVSATGYTGERGCELYIALDRLEPLWNDLLAAGAKPAGLGARDTLRLEAGLPLYGHELSADLTPVEAGFTRYASKASDFVGAAAVRGRLVAGPAWRLTAFAAEGRASARAGQRIRDAAANDVGWVTSGSFAPTLGCAIGFAYVCPSLAAPGTALAVDTGRAPLPIRTATAPLYRRPSPT